LPRSAGIDVRIFLESQPRWLSFESGALWISSIPKEQVKNARDNPKFVIVESAVPNVIRVSFNMDSAVLGAAAPQGLAIRHAISRALDREEYIRTFLDGEGEKAFGPVPPGVVGYSSGVKAAASTKPAGHPGATFKGTTVEFNSLGDSNWRQFSEWLTLKLAPLGITVKPVFLRAPEWRARIEKRQGDLWVERWSADYPDAESFLQLYYGKNKAPGANDSGYANPEFDRLYEKMLGEQRPAERTRLSLAMQKLLIRDAPAAWLTHETSRVALLARDGNRKNGPRLRALL
jgi:ABC-type oligopeptide transport system substrate-binding subunit